MMLLNLRNFEKYEHENLTLFNKGLLFHRCFNSVLQILIFLDKEISIIFLNRLMFYNLPNCILKN